MTGDSQSDIIKYNAKARIWKADDVSVDKIDMIVDLDNCETGQMRFAENSALDFRMVKVNDLLNGVKSRQWRRQL